MDRIELIMTVEEFFEMRIPEEKYLPLVSEVIKLLITIVGQISKFKFR